MKIILLFALASVSVCWDNDGDSCQSSDETPSAPFRCDSKYKENFAEDKVCMLHVLQNYPELLVAGERLICKHYRNQMNKKEEFYQGFKDELIEFLECLSCSVGSIVVLQESLGEVGAAVGSAAGDVIKLVGEIIHGIGAAEPALDLLCIVSSKLLTSECMEAITSHQTPTIAQGIIDLSSEMKKPIMNVPHVVGALGNVGCLEDDAQNLNFDAIPVETTADLCKILSPLVDTLLGDIKPTLKDVLSNLESEGELQLSSEFRALLKSM
ncbi:uncharacterized protein [Engystomops pustulosus]|uniref:uncharacterized protein isoform X1 n=1 Tax=Engystomops pustulosus TaxID=76066 RepID=UPI003AFA0DB9